MVAAWGLLFVAIALEVAGTSAIGRTQSFTNVPWALFVIAAYVLSTWFLAIVVRTIPISVAYAIWAGVGTALVAAVGWLYLGEGMDWTKALFLSLIIVGVVGLNLATS